MKRPGNLDFQAYELFRNVRSPAANLFMKLNADTQWLKPGQILIIADPDSPLKNQMLQPLQLARQKTNAAVAGVSVEEASFMQKHYGMIAGLTYAGDKIFGTVGDTGKILFSDRANADQTSRRCEESAWDHANTAGAGDAY